MNIHTRFSVTVWGIVLFVITLLFLVPHAVVATTTSPLPAGWQIATMGEIRQAAEATPAAGQSPPPPDLAEQLQAVEPLLPSLYLGMRLFPSLPTLIGLHGPQRYLLVVQNSDELRATGGFISALGSLTLDQGRVTELEFVDSYRLYRTTAEYPPAPPPMQQWMNIYYLLFRDANWSPDFPTTAMLLRTLYREETGVVVDGIVTVDLYALQYIVGALAPLRLPNATEQLTEANVLSQVKALWGQPEAGETITDVGLGQWWGQRKNFIPALAASVLEKVQSGDIDYVALAMAAERALHERAIQIWLADESAAAQLAQLGWDGRLRVEPDRDYLSLIDTNMGYNKANAAIERSLHYTVTWPAGENAPAEATVTIDYRHPIALPNHTCDITPRYGSDYQDLVERCFFNYVRLYVPLGSELVDATGFYESDSINTSRGERRTQIFAGYFVLPPGEHRRVQFRYRLPASLSQAQYQLIVQRQAGSGPLPLTVTVGAKTEQVLLREGLFLVDGDQ